MSAAPEISISCLDFSSAFWLVHLTTFQMFHFDFPGATSSQHVQKQTYLLLLNLHSTWLLESETWILPPPITPHPIGEGRIMAPPKKSTF